MPVFWPKTVIFAEIRACRLKKKFSGKFMHFQGNCPIGLKIGINVPQDPYYNSYLQILWIFIWCFGHFTGPDMCRDGYFLLNCNNCSRGPKVHLYQFLGQLDHFPRKNRTFPQKFFFLIHFLKSQKMTVFGQKRGIFRPILPKFWELMKNT